ncbi:MAG: D-hexose-6-phosphate mutarotase [Phormidesmis priestleyi]|uniref:Putative glucose-6-phosphate 1-epimerase n=1 Tax=Phormidesmis priestleyi TaxID=268141 RepID=A0A2W4XG20_9CYAN|nr:MAG: D-hexose-6-phosphate mutarotase [Phormidesmis priestleyi]
MSIEQLNQTFAISSQLEIVESKGGFPAIEIQNEKASAKISVYSAQVLSFQPVDEPEEMLFVSENAYYQTGKATKGGIPICWPWFGPDPQGLGRASHGFVRNRMWTLLSTEAMPTGETKVRLGMSANEETQAIWPYQFELVMEIVVGQRLAIALITQNTGSEAFSITQAFHTYFSIGDIHQVRVLGLEDTPYLDKADEGAEKTQIGEIAITAETDRIYVGVKPELIVEDSAWGRRILISSTNSSTAIVWNPWEKISAAMADLADSDYLNFVCVETANAENEVIEISPGEQYQMQAVYAIERS